MLAYISHDGELLAKYPIRGNAPLDCDHYARRYASDLGCTVDPDCFDKPSHYIPSGGDFTVTVAERAQGWQGASCWMERRYYVAPESTS